MTTYEEVLGYVLRNGLLTENRTGVRTLSVFAPSLQIDHDLSRGFPLLTSKHVSFKGVATELAWFLSGSTNVKYLQERGVKIWDQNADPLTGELGPIYGHQWRNYGAPYDAREPGQRKDQILGLVQDMTKVKRDPSASEARRLILTAWNPVQVSEARLPPCHVMAQFNVRHGSLSCCMTMRSADLFLGVPYNLASYALLTHLFAHTVGLNVGRVVIRFGDAHIYVNHIDQVKEQIRRRMIEPRPFPSLQLATEAHVLSFSPEHARVVGYDPHPALPAPMAV